MNSLTSSAQATTDVVTALGVLLNTNWILVLHYLGIGFIGLLLVPTIQQHLIELLDNQLNIPMVFKMFVPTVFSLILGMCTKAFGVDNATALSIAGTLAAMTHVINESPLALNLTGKLPIPLLTVAKKALDAAQTGGKVAILLLGLLAISGALKADVTPSATVAGWCAGPGVWAGSAMYRTTSGGLTPDQSAMGGVQFAGYLGSWQDQDFTPTYTLGVVLGLDTQNTSNYPAVGVQGGWYLNGVPVTGFVAWRLDSQASGAMVGVGTSVQFSGWVPFLYLGKPGN